MKDVSSTTFGLLIAFLLPGFVGLYGLTYWSPGVSRLFDSFLTAQSSAGFFLLVTLAALVLGLQATLLRWLLFERWLCRNNRLQPGDSAELSDDAKLAAFRAAVDEHYRYHQFWGGMSLVLPPVYIGWVKTAWSTLGCSFLGLSFLVFLGFESLNFFAAVSSYQSFMGRARRILRGT